MAMEPNYSPMFLQYDDAENRLGLFTCSEEFFSEEDQAKLQLSVIPKFLIYQGGILRQTIDGAKYDELCAAITKYIPEGPED